MGIETTFNNVVGKEKLREIQSKILADLSDILTMSFGPNGSNTCIKKIGSLNQYTKDGHTILSSILYHGPIEASIKEDIEAITRYITVTVGDGTTSAVILSKLIFDEFTKNEKFKNILPYELIKAFQNVVKEITSIIKANAKEVDLQTIYDICMISTNGNEEVSKVITDIYKEYGMEVFIDVAISNSTESILKNYDGMTLNNGFSDSCYVNNKTDNTCTIDYPCIYFFEDPIDTPEMAVFLNTILSDNIITHIQNKDTSSIVPTVIITPKISRDVGSVIESMCSLLNQMPTENRIPLLIITDVYQIEEYLDICKLCGAKTIKKYIDPKLQDRDIEMGLAPTPDTISDWYGTCDRIISDANKTKFINPASMKGEDGEYSAIYKNLLEFLQAELKKAEENGDDARVKGTLKRRINSLKSNLVEYLVGGVTMADRDSLRDLVEDAVLNCRSAALNGVGYGANFEGLLASDKYVRELSSTNMAIMNILKYTIGNSIYTAYKDLLQILYSTSINDNTEANKMVDTSIYLGMPYNLRTMNENGNNVLSSIESDIIILDTISKIVSIMMTCNQFVVPTVQHNTYIELK